MSLSPEVLTIYILDAVIVVFASIAFYLSLQIVFKYNKNNFSQEQYRLQMQSYLSATIIKFLLYLKLLMFAFFIFTLDKLSDILVGAMCAAGVVNATEYGTPLLIFKILNLYIFAFWLTLHNEDMKNEAQPYFKTKFMFYIAAYILLMLEILIEVVMFSSIDIQSVVDCCGAIFSVTDTTYISEILSQDKLLTYLFYANFIVLGIGYIMKNRVVFGLFNLSYIIVSLLSLIAFFGTYIYQQPTHHCPFCMLQKDYFYVGYFLYIFLFLGTYYGISLLFLQYEAEEVKKRFQRSLIFSSLYMVTVSYYVVTFYIKNGVWLS